jgi:hypothetical protein
MVLRSADALRDMPAHTVRISAHSAERAAQLLGCQLRAIHFSVEAEVVAIAAEARTPRSPHFALLCPWRCDRFVSMLVLASGSELDLPTLPLMTKA